MTEPRAIEPFEARLGELVQAYTKVAADRPFDARAVSRAALSTRGAAGWVGGMPGWRIAGAPWAAALAAVIVVAVAAIMLLQRPPGPATEPATTPSATAPTTLELIPEEMRHAWQRPYAVTPDQDEWGSGYLDVSGGILALRQSVSDPRSRSTIARSGIDTFVATANAETANCAGGDVGEYRWTIDGDGTVLKLSTVAPDACAARAASLVGTWVRADLPPPGGGEVVLLGGTYQTKEFDPFRNPEVTGQLSFRVPDGWSLIDEPRATALFRFGPEASQPGVNVLVFAEPRVAADFEEGAECGGPARVADGVGTGVDDIVATISARPGVEAAPPTDVSIGGHDGQQLDLRLAPSWTGGCIDAGRPVVGSLILSDEGGGPVAGLGPDVLGRLIVLDLGNGRTIAIAIGSFGSDDPSVLEAGIADAMEVVESFEFHPPVP